MWRAGISALAVLLLLWGCTTVGPGAGSTQARILVMGDSVMDWNAKAGASIPHVMGTALNQPIQSRAIAGAHVIYNLPLSGAAGFKISNQYIDGDWDWVVLNGGGNDVWLGCNCTACDDRLNRMISADGGAGEIPALVSRIRQSGAQVLYLGYLRSPGLGSPIEDCKDEAEVLERRLAQMANRSAGVHFLSLADLVPYGDASFHSADRVHPSPKGSRAIGLRVSNFIAARAR